MGNYLSSSAQKFRRAIAKGDEAEAIRIYTEDEKFAKQLDLGAVYDPPAKYGGNTALHYICDNALDGLLQLTLPHDGKRAHQVRMDSRGKGLGLKKMSVRVPKGKRQGETFMVSLANGNLMRVAVPRNARPGTVLSVSYNVKNAAGGANPYAKNEAGRTPLELLVSKADNPAKRLEMLQHLWNYRQAAGAALNVNYLGSHKRTILHSAAETGLSLCVMFLIDKGANLDAKDTKGETPALLAEAGGHKRLAAKLEAMTIYNPLHIQSSQRFQKELSACPRTIQISHKGYRNEYELEGEINRIISRLAKNCNINTFSAECLLARQEWNQASIEGLWANQTARRTACRQAGISASEVEWR